MSAPELSIVVPTYGSAAALPALLARLAEALASLGLSHEVVVVNDASPDGTWSVLQELAAWHPELVAVDLLHNQGQPLATLCGLSHARGRLVATMDDDLQHPPEELPKLVRALVAHPDWDAAVGSWPRDEGVLRDLGSALYGRLTRYTAGAPAGFRHSAFQVMRRPVVDAILEHPTRTPVVSSLLFDVTRRVHNVEVAHHDRPHGRSNFRFGVGAGMVLNELFKHTTLPLKVLCGVGLVAAAFATGLGSFYVARSVLGVETPPGWASTFLAVVFFGGVALFGIGLQGFYLALLLREVRRPPRWSVRGRLGPAQPAARERPRPAPRRAARDTARAPVAPGAAGASPGTSP